MLVYESNTGRPYLKRGCAKCTEIKAHRVKTVLEWLEIRTIRFSFSLTCFITERWGIVGVKHFSVFVLNSQPLPEGTLFVTHKPGRNLEADSESVITDPKNEAVRDKILCLHGVGGGRGGDGTPVFTALCWASPRCPFQTVRHHLWKEK